MDGIDDLTQREPGFPLIVGVPTSLCQVARIVTRATVQ